MDQSVKLFFAIGALVALPATGQEQPGSNFSLLKGKGIEVCDAYLARLNRTTFELDPYCDRSGGADTPGFSTLSYVALEREEVLRLYAPAQGLLFYSDARFYEKNPGIVRGVRGIDRDAERYANQQLPPHISSADVKENLPRFFRYSPPVDLDNDGKPDDVVVWRAPSPACGVATQREALRAARFLIFLDEERNLDVDRTLAVFGSRKWNVYGAGSPGGPPARIPHFPGMSFGVFEYRQQFFYDTFYSNHDDPRSSDPSFFDTLAVFKHQNGVSSLQCELKWNRLNYKAE